MKCTYKGCTADATLAMAINVPATGVPIDQHQPLKMFLGLKVCAEHFPDVDKATDFLSPQLRAIFNQMTAGRVPPDFDRAFWSKVRLDDPEYLLLQRQANR